MYMFLTYVTNNAAPVNWTRHVFVSVSFQDPNIVSLCHSRANLFLVEMLKWHVKALATNL